MKQYQELIHKILLDGDCSEDRTGVGTTSLFGTRMEFNLKEGFPALTTKRLAWKSVVGELMWFLEGSTNINRLNEIQNTKRNIWTANYEKQAKDLGYTEGELGPVYGFQFHHENQLNNFIKGIQLNPDSRRHIISLWNPSDTEDMALPPCHGLTIQAYVQAGELSIQWYQRSVDSFLGLPFNIASYALFTHIIAKICNLKVGKLIFCGGDTHIYNNHTDQCGELLSRDPLRLPTLSMPNFRTLHQCLSFTPEDFKLNNYTPYPPIMAPMAV